MVSFGIPKLDRVFGGGIPEKSVTAITGPTGVGKTTLAMQFLINGIKEGDRALYIPMEMTKSTLMASFSNSSWDIEEYEELGTLLIIDYPYHEIDQFVAQSNPLKEIIDKYDISRVVVDSILPIMSSVKTQEERDEVMVKAFDRMRDWGASTFVISEGNQPEADEFSISPWGVERHADNWISMRYDFEENTRFMRVVKVRGQRHSFEEIEFSIDKNGIKV